jgi:hypothetical protein
LATVDGRLMDAVVKCSAHQIEQLTPLWLDLPGTTVGAARAQIEVPQVSSWQIHERFRWPIDEVLLISRGIVAMPGLKRPVLGGLPPLLGTTAPRADALLLLECRTEAEPGMAGHPTSSRLGGLNYHGRY